MQAMTNCELVYEGAYAVMALRNAGEPLNKMLRAFKSGDMRAVTLRAYDLRQGLWTPQEFANDEMLACEKGR
jgi:hypothetical protein